MYTVLLVDDESAVLQALQSSIPWEELGVEAVYHAADGIHALDIFSQHQIDLLITDIKMPRMDGIELLRQVRSRYPQTHCILLTAYGEFEYARSAFMLGVENYLLKPLNITEITDTVQNAIDNIAVGRSNKDLLFRENILRRWLTGSISSEELVERARLFHLGMYSNSYCVVAIRKISKAAHLTGIDTICASQMPHNGECLSVWDNAGRMILIFSGCDLTQQWVAEVFKNAIDSRKMGDSVIAAVGTCVSSSDQLPLSYQESCRKIDQTESGNPGILLCTKEMDILAALPIIDFGSLSPIVMNAINYIQTNYANGASVKEFCANHTVTPAYVGSLFKRETGVFFNNYLNGYRMTQAIDLLIHTQMKVHDIAERTGFTSTSYFISSFRKYAGMSPQRYREQHI